MGNDEQVIEASVITSIRQTEARALYSRLGFEVIPPYYELPADLRDWLVFMELTL